MNVLMKTSAGNITLELDADKAPETVQNFATYVADSFYNNTIFHRVIPGFMIQCGGFEPGMLEKPTSGNLKNEANNGLRNDAGTIAMARTNDPHSATAQFFINVKDNDFLNHTSESPNGWGYCVFGKVTDGLDIVMAIAGVATTTRDGHGDVPQEDVIIESIETITGQ